MKMAPIYAPDGRLLGHLNLEECAQTRDSMLVTDLSRSLRSLSSLDNVELMDKTIKYFHVSLRTLRFHCKSEEGQVMRCLVANELPDWFWSAHSTVKFSSDHWERV